MNTLLIFIGVTAFVGAVGYLAIRAFILARWERWREEQAEARAIQQRTQRRQALREQAAASALRQLAQREASLRSVGRKAA